MMSPVWTSQGFMSACHLIVLSFSIHSLLTTNMHLAVVDSLLFIPKDHEGVLQCHDPKVSTVQPLCQLTLPGLIPPLGLIPRLRRLFAHIVDEACTVVK